MRSHVIAAAVVIAGIAIGVGAHEDHAEAESTAFTGMTPILNVAQCRGDSSIVLTSVLGFKKDWDWPAEGEDKTFASVSNGPVHVFLSENSQGASAGCGSTTTSATSTSCTRNTRRRERT